VVNYGKKSLHEAGARELDLTEYQLRRMAKEKKIPFLMSGTRYIFEMSYVLNF
jgi:hypothetical protein